MEERKHAVHYSGAEEQGTSASQVIALYRQLERLGIRVWLDGGWGVDALLGKQTRTHEDVDIVVEEKDVAALRSVLAAIGFAELLRQDTRPWNFALRNAMGCKVDVHVIVLDARGNGIYGPPEHGESYPAAALLRRGAIKGLPVNCMSPEYQMANHTGYELRGSDHHDVRALAEKFGLDIPEEHRSARTGENG